MHLKKLLAIFASLTTLVSAGPGGFLQMTNLTPYKWVLKYSHSYHVTWKPPSTISSGTSIEQYFEYHHDHGPNGDCGAEAVYELEGSPVSASFTVQARQKNGKKIQIQYGGQLASLGNPVASLLTLGFEHDGSVFFTLAGDENGKYVSSNPPLRWMQDTLPTIGSMTLRNIAMPMAHDAGMSQMTRIYGGVPHNVETQSVHMYQQLVYGARWFDIRPVIRKGKWYTNHMTKNNIGAIGGFGRKIWDLIKDINRFTAEHPGELIVLDLTHEMDRSGWKLELTDAKWQNLYSLLYNGINDIYLIDDSKLPEDLSTVPISTFIQPGSKSAVIVRIPDHAPEWRPAAHKRDMEISSSAYVTYSATDEPLDPNTPSLVPVNATLEASGPDEEIPDISDITGLPDNSTAISDSLLPAPKPPQNLPPAFIPAQRLPTVGSYSDTNNDTFLASDQLQKLSYFRPSASNTMHQSTWTITQDIFQVLDVFEHSQSIIGLSVYAQHKLFSSIWSGLSRETYPNLIEVDNIHNNQITALCLAINEHFARGKDMAKKGKLAKRMMAFKGRAVEEVRVENEGMSRAIKWFRDAVWCSLKLGGISCWADPKDETQELSHVWDGRPLKSTEKGKIS